MPSWLKQTTRLLYEAPSRSVQSDPSDYVLLRINPVYLQIAEIPTRRRGSIPASMRVSLVSTWEVPLASLSAASLASA
ncbi:hypothetical protein GGTG_11503 [Gaeumannomyces tritici R3-111a-1]|uniref:Uncharacterized protein n=1 Tax=Gaeumannomyces tritici (strain R3-111a-1) TaxID=644352 RepID=J3PDD5_GAET3|nr:hypothetical protein GGTG_11503 [Gaeumannomyces tritici R3-111a-1]EJT70480.1 hypothetical protein GGTG_11503 [Gaeumannomyces tritici R3-111a-1]